MVAIGVLSGNRLTNSSNSSQLICCAELAISSHKTLSFDSLGRIVERQFKLPPVAMARMFLGLRMNRFARELESGSVRLPVRQPLTFNATDRGEGTVDVTVTECWDEAVAAPLGAYEGVSN